MTAISIKTGLIGLPDIQIPIDEDLGKIFVASQGQLLIPMLLAQVLRDLQSVKEGLRKLEDEVSTLGSTPERLQLGKH